MIAVDFPVKFRSLITMKYCLLRTNNHGRVDFTNYLIDQVNTKLLVACKLVRGII